MEQAGKRYNGYVREEAECEVIKELPVRASQTIRYPLYTYVRVCSRGGVVAVELGAIDDDARDGAGSPIWCSREGEVCIGLLLNEAGEGERCTECLWILIAMWFVC